MLGKLDGRRRRLNGITNLMNLSLSKVREIVKDREAWHAAVHWVTQMIVNFFLIYEYIMHQDMNN